MKIIPSYAKPYRFPIMHPKLAIALLLLTGCSQPAPCPPPIAVKQWTKAEQDQILAEERKLPDGSILIPVLEDYVRLRLEVK